MYIADPTHPDHLRRLCRFNAALPYAATADAVMSTASQAAGLVRDLECVLGHGSDEAGGAKLDTLYFMMLHSMEYEQLQCLVRGLASVVSDALNKGVTEASTTVRLLLLRMFPLTDTDRERLELAHIELEVERFAEQSRTLLDARFDELPALLTFVQRHLHGQDYAFAGVPSELKAKWGPEMTERLGGAEAAMVERGLNLAIEAKALDASLRDYEAVLATVPEKRLAVFLSEVFNCDEEALAADLPIMAVLPGSLKAQHLVELRKQLRRWATQSSARQEETWQWSRTFLSERSAADLAALQQGVSPAEDPDPAHRFLMWFESTEDVVVPAVRDCVFDLVNEVIALEAAAERKARAACYVQQHVRLHAESRRARAVLLAAAAAVLSAAEATVAEAPPPDEPPRRGLAAGRWLLSEALVALFCAMLLSLSWPVGSVPVGGAWPDASVVPYETKGGVAIGSVAAPPSTTRDEEHGWARAVLAPSGGATLFGAAVLPEPAPALNSADVHQDDAVDAAAAEADDGPTGDGAAGDEDPAAASRESQPTRRDDSVDAVVAGADDGPTGDSAAGIGELASAARTSEPKHRGDAVDPVVEAGPTSAGAAGDGGLVAAVRTGEPKRRDDAVEAATVEADGAISDGTAAEPTAAMRIRQPQRRDDAVDPVVSGGPTSDRAVIDEELAASAQTSLPRPMDEGREPPRMRKIDIAFFGQQSVGLLHKAFRTQPVDTPGVSISGVNGLHDLLAALGLQGKLPAAAAWFEAQGLSSVAELCEFEDAEAEADLIGALQLKPLQRKAAAQAAAEARPASGLTQRRQLADIKGDICSPTLYKFPEPHEASCAVARCHSCVSCMPVDVLWCVCPLQCPE